MTKMYLGVWAISLKSRVTQGFESVHEPHQSKGVWKCVLLFYESQKKKNDLEYLCVLAYPAARFGWEKLYGSWPTDWMRELFNERMMEWENDSMR